MQSKGALEHGGAVAREAVRLGLAELDRVRALFQEYQQDLSQGGELSFTEVLLVRGAISAEGFRRLEQALPFASGPASAQGEATRAYPAVVPLAPLTAPGAGLESSEELPRGQWLGQGSAPPTGAPDRRTGAFHAVLRIPGEGEDDDEDALDAEEDAPLGLLSAEGAPISAPPRPAPTPPPRPATTPPPRTALGAPTPRPAPAPGRGTPAPAPALRPSDHERLAEGLLESGDIDARPSDRIRFGSEPHPGDDVGGHRLESAIGRGAMGVVYRAVHLASGNRVALKVLVGAQEGPEADRRRQRFRREFEALRRLEHERIVRVHDYGRTGPFDWYSMDLVDGLDLEQQLLRDKLDLIQRLKVFEDVCAALAHAHERQVVHRDLKPQNVLVDRAGRGYVLDFGLAKLLDQQMAMTRSGAVLGTPYYMSPEQLKSSKVVDTRSDVFALGVILYELTTGQRPFGGKNAAEVAEQILHRHPTPPSKADPRLDPGVDAICARAMAKEPEERYPDATALLEDLRRWRRGEGVAARPGWLRRHALGVGLGLVASLLLVPLFLWLLRSLGR